MATEYEKLLADHQAIIDAWYAKWLAEQKARIAAVFAKRQGVRRA
jgi:hypothetical protein